MANEQRIDKAVANLVAWYQTYFAAQLRLVEVAQSLDAGSLPDPEEIIGANVPFDNRSPLVCIYEEHWQDVDVRNGVLAVECTIAVSYSSDADLAVGKTLMRRYMTAIANTIKTSGTLGGTVARAILTDGSSDAFRGGDTSQTRHVFGQGVNIHVQD